MRTQRRKEYSFEDRWKEWQFVCNVGSWIMFNCGLWSVSLPSIICIHCLMSMRWSSRYLPSVCNSLWLFRYECSAWLWMFYGLVKFYWVKSPNQSAIIQCNSWWMINEIRSPVIFYRNQWTGGKGVGFLQQDLCSYLNVADPRIRRRKEKTSSHLTVVFWCQTCGSLVHGETF